MKASTASALEWSRELRLKSLLLLPHGEREVGLGKGTPSHSCASGSPMAELRRNQP